MKNGKKLTNRVAESKVVALSAKNGVETSLAEVCRTVYEHCNEANEEKNNSLANTNSKQKCPVNRTVEKKLVTSTTTKKYFQLKIEIGQVKSYGHLRQ